MENTETKLKRLSRKLRQSPLFNGLSEDFPLVEKQNIFLTIAGMKPVSEVVSCHWEATHNGRRSVPDDPADVQNFLVSLGCMSTVTVDTHRTTAIISTRLRLLKQYEVAESANDVRKIGLLFGYPNSAVNAYVGGQRLSWDYQTRLVRDAGLEKISGFIMSRENWELELALLRSWLTTLQCYGLA